jgi:LysM repeat protein
MTATIGIKLANREFYPILEENSSVKERIVLTTVHDDQKSVQIDLYKSRLKTMSDALYIGSLVIEDLVPRPRGVPSVELILSSTEEGGIIADAVDLDARGGGERYRLDISLASQEGNKEDILIPDFELEAFADISSDRTRKKHGLWPFLVLVIGGALVILIWLGIWLFLSHGPRDRQEVSGQSGVENPVRELPVAEAVPPEPEPLPPPPPPPVPPPEAVPPPVITAPAEPPPPAPSRSRAREAAPVARYKIPAVIPAGGVPYKIQWGDTLWEISEAFYRNPWLYPRIARFNNIRNPNRIISGTTIRIPPRN